MCERVKYKWLTYLLESEYAHYRLTIVRLMISCLAMVSFLALVISLGLLAYQ